MFDNFKKLFKRKDEYIPLPEGYDSEVFTRVMERAITSEQQTNVLRTAYHLSRLWATGDTSQIPGAIVMVEEAYPYMEQMAKLEIFGEEWLIELTKVIELTANSREVLLCYPKEFRQLLFTALENLKPD